MFVATIVVTTVLLLMLLISARRKLARSPEVVESYRRVGVPPSRLGVLAALLIGGGIGVVAGLAWPPIGIAAASCLVAYFVLAIAAHVGRREFGTIATPMVILLASAATLGLRLASI